MYLTCKVDILIAVKRRSATDFLIKTLPEDAGGVLIGAGSFSIWAEAVPVLGGRQPGNDISRGIKMH
jgi:hypothetical protein